MAGNNEAHVSELPQPSRPAFMLDHMVIRLGKYLRIAGYDAEWDLLVRTHELIVRANTEGRLFITRNRRLPCQYPVPQRAVVLIETDPVQQLRRLEAELGIDLQSRLFWRCIRCNVALLLVENPTSLTGRVHPNVLRQHTSFYTCPSCGTVFWRGSHVRNTCRKLGLRPPAGTSPDEHA